MRNNIPMELRCLPQWVCAGPDKIPLNPRTGQKAIVTNRSTWATFDEAIRSGMKYVGFVLTEEDPYTIIDLDNKPDKPASKEQLDRHAKLINAFDSYTERSASGTGYHIIVKGRIPAGVHRDCVEVYSSARYMICTGDSVRQAPIADYQELLDILFKEMTPAQQVDLVNSAGLLDDEDLFDMAMRASNGDKFDQLCRGEWESMGYESQSEADFALLSILAFYTMDNDQVRRLFRMTILGRREKAIKNDTYLNFALRKIRANTPPPIDFSELVSIPPPEVVPDKALPALTLPPGLVGEVAQYIYQTAVRPVAEVALGGALALVAGVCGRSYNISGTGLNQYIIILAKTGAGKEGAASGMDNLIAAVRPHIPMVDQFVGPGAFASGQALIKILDDRPCFVSVLGEFGLTLQQICDPRANSAQVMLKKVLLDLYSKSGWNKILRSSVYSDSDKNTCVVQAPNVTILGESTQESFFAKIDSSHIAEGLIPRFLIIEYTGPRPERNKNANTPPPQALVDKFTELVTISLTTANNGTCANVQIENKALVLLDAFDVKADGIINSSGADIDMEIWNRAHLKALKLSAIIAVGNDPHSPKVTEEIAKWAINFVERDVSVMTTRFSKGEVGDGDHRHESDIRRAVDQFLAMSAKIRSTYKVPAQLLTEPVVPFHYLRRKVRLLTAFKNDKRGTAKALEDSLKDMVKAEVLKLIPVQQAVEKYKVQSELYVKGPTW